MIDKDEFKSHIINGKTIKELQLIYNCSRSRVAELKKYYGLVGLSPNSKKLDRDVGTKECSICAKNLPFSDFYSNGKTSTGKVKYKPSCITCENLQRKNIFVTMLFDYLDVIGKAYECEKCGFSGIYGTLDFHHREPKNKSFNVGDSNYTVSVDTFMSKVVPEIEKCMLLCPNCHRVEHLLMGPI